MPPPPRNFLLYTVEESLLQHLPEGRDGRLTAATWAALRTALIGRPNQAAVAANSAAAAANHFLSKRKGPRGRSRPAFSDPPSSGGGEGGGTVAAAAAVPILAAGHNTIITPANFDSLVLNKVKRKKNYELPEVGAINVYVSLEWCLEVVLQN
jgi:hypothetical protein